MNSETSETSPQTRNRAKTIFGKIGNFAINGRFNKLKLNNANP